MLPSSTWLFSPLENPGFLRLSGPDRVAFLQRQTTNDVRSLQGARFITTVLTSPAARILDVFILIDEGDSIGIITLPGRARASFEFLRKRIFFNDKVSLHDASADIAQIILLSDPELLFSTLEIPPLEQDNENGSFSLGGPPILYLRQPAFTSPGFRFLIPVPELPRFEQRLNSAGFSKIEPGSLEILRVEAGLPGAASELTEDFTPLETNLDKYISHHKGCYTGQEIIARQVNYDKITRKLIGVRLEKLVSPNTTASVEGSPVGIITSAAESPRLGPIVLAVIKRPYNEPGVTLAIQSGDQTITGTVVKLPFEGDN